MTTAEVRDRLTHALRLDLIGPDPGEPQLSEILNIAPSRWYLTGFLVPWNAPVSQKQDVEDTQGELELGEAGSGGDEDDSTPEPPAARRGHFPSSIGLSVLVSGEAQDLRVTARWGDYTPIEKDGKPTGEWQRHEREETVPLRLTGKQANPPPTPVPNSDGLDIITSVRRVRRLENLPGLPKGVLAVSVFLVNGRRAEDRPELKDMRFAFQASLTLDADRPLVSRPNPRGQDPGGDADERIADLQYRDVMEFAVGHGTATRAIVVAGVCRKVATTWMPEAEVERVEPSIMTGVELGMEALAAMPDAASVRAGLAPIVTEYRGWIDTQRAKAPKGGVQGEVADDLFAARSARRESNRSRPRGAGRPARAARLPADQSSHGRGGSPAPSAGTEGVQPSAAASALVAPVSVGISAR